MRVLAHEWLCIVFNTWWAQLGSKSIVVFFYERLWVFRSLLRLGVRRRMLVQTTRWIRQRHQRRYLECKIDGFQTEKLQEPLC